MEKDMMLAYGEGRRKRRSPMKRWMEEILISGMNLAELRDAVEDRDLWRKLEKWYGKGCDAGIRREKKKRQSDEEVDGGNAHIRDRDLWRKLTMTIARALRVDSTRCQDK